jgi:hypothetical protein
MRFLDYAVLVMHHAPTVACVQTSWLSRTYFTILLSVTHGSVVVRALCRKVVGSRPDEVNEFFPSGRTRSWGLLSL